MYQQTPAKPQNWAFSRPAPGRLGVLSLLGVLLLGVLLSTALWFIADYFNRPPEGKLHVVVANFADADGRTGQLVAEDLVQALQQQVDDRVLVEHLEVTPDSAQNALNVAENQQADLLIWGEVLPGALSTSPTLLPRLIYIPSGWHVPNLWFNYQGRFVMPRSFELADQPVNGQATLPRLIMALAEYHLGNPDLAANQLGDLIAEYPFNPALPHALRGNVFWARGMFPEAEREYRQALAQPGAEQARLTNNLAAIQIDAANPQYRQTINAAIEQLDGRDLGELRFNLGLAELREGRLAQAAVEFEQARNLLPPNTAILLAISSIYRNIGYLAAAESSLAAAEAQIQADVATVPPEQRFLLRGQLRASLAEQRGRLLLAQQVDARGPLRWELEIAPPQPARQFDAAHDSLRDATDASNALISDWVRFANASAADVPESESIAVNQIQLARELHNRHRQGLALALIEQARYTLNEAPGLIEGTLGALFGRATPMSEAVGLLNEVLTEEPGNAPAMIALGRAMRLQNQLVEANERYDQIIALVPDWPDGFYGKADLARREDDLLGARLFLEQAIARNDTYFPALLMLADIAEQQNDWPTAIASRRRLAEVLETPASTIELARTLHASGTGSAEAEALLLPLAEQGSAVAYLELARIYRDTGRPDLAIAAFEGARRNDPRSPEAAYELGMSLAEAGRLAEAEEQLRIAVGNDPGNARIRLAYADVLQQQGNTAAASQEYRQLLESTDISVDELIRIGDTLAANGDSEAASAAYQAAVERNPEHVKALQRVAYARFAQGNLAGASEAAQQVVERAATLPGEEPRILRASALALQGDIARRNGDRSMASAYYLQALQVDPVQVEARLGLGMLAAEEGNWAAALGEFERAASYPGGVNNPLVHFWIGEARLRLDNYEGAVAAYSRALELRPNFADAQFGLAQTFKAQGMPEAALDRVERALAIRPAYAEALLFKGKLLQERGDSDGALAAYNASIDANNQIAETFYRRGLIELQRLNYGRAVSDLERAVELQPNFPEAHYWLGRAYLAQERHQRALESLQRAVDLQQGNYPEARYYQGLAEEQLGMLEQALASYLAVVQHDPGGNWGNRAQVEIERLQTSADVLP